MNLGGAVRLNKFGVLVLLCCFILFLYYMSPKAEETEKRTVNLRHLLLASIEIAERGGKEVVKARNDPDLKEGSKGKTKEGANVPVTSADIRSDCVMLSGMSESFPDIMVISEEKSNTEKCNSFVVEIDDKGREGLKDLKNVEVDTKNVAVWIDPLDATQEFTENLLEYVTTMVCVSVNGKPTIGVIHRPFATEFRTVWGWVNHGHSPIPKPLGQEVNEEVVTISRSHRGNAEKFVKSAFGENIKIIKAGGSGFKVLQLISGNATIYFHSTDIHKWDICAGDAILTAMNGKFSTIDGEDINYAAYKPSTNAKGVLATSNADKHSDYSAKLMDAIKKFHSTSHR